MLTTLVISNAFRGLLLGWYVNVNTELAVGSLDELIAKTKVEIYHDGILESLKPDERAKISKLLKRIPEALSHKSDWLLWKESHLIYCNELYNSFCLNTL